MRALGAHVERRGGADGWRVLGVGVGGLAEPEAVLDFGNSGTSTRLLAGLLATHPLTAFVTGDASLVRRPMGRVTTPLERMGAQFICRSGGRLPMAVLGTDSAVPITYALPVASAQVKSAVLLAGLNTPGHTTVIEPQPTRDHSEHLLRHFGAEVQIEDMAGVGQAITIIGQPELAGRVVRVPGDISSAAFPIVAALIVPGSDLILVDVGLNPRRTGLLATLWEMGADIEVFNHRSEAGEPAADLRVRTSALRGIDVPPERAPRMIDEYPALAVAAACAAGTTRMLGVGELRVKESDRIAMMAAGLAACGAAVEAGPDTLTVHGTGAAPPGGVRVATSLDHRIAMSFLVLGTATAEPVAIDDAGPIETSFPGFVEVMNAAGGRIGAASVEAG
jgi:3-phosphoshikimate 1-carboxyvinyltransferase